MLKFLLQESLDALTFTPEIRSDIEEGRRTFLFGDDGEFLA